MTPDDWKKIKTILEAAIDLDPAERPGFLADKCKGNDQMRQEIESLLISDNTNAEFLEVDLPGSIFEIEKPSERIGERVGPYKIVDEIGTGGMGIVYLAERADGAFDQRVALKLIKRGMDSTAILKRFFNERQILASLDHPNIARLIDGGTTKDGLPYFVMEYIDGETILGYTAANQLSIAARLDLFRKICSAVSFAHSNLVVHRDLKPSNILVGKDGNPKLLDFGIAKILKPENDEVLTATQQFAFTPEYASPEQVRGEQLTTSTDVYSLGIILYELLTGNRPYVTASRNISEIVRTVCEAVPLRPSAAVVTALASDPPLNVGNARELRGDLDNIVLKALRKEPERRYSSVEHLSGDIRRHLRGLPVSATPDTWSYRSAKFIRRNRIAFVGAVLVLISLLAGLFTTLHQRNKAQARFNDVRQMANSFLFEFHDSIEDLPGSTPARELVVKRALEYLNQLSQESEGDPTLRRELAAAYNKIGQIQGNSYYSNLGDTDGAMTSYLRALEIRQSLSDADPENRELRHELADSLEGVGDMHYTVNELEKGLEIYERAVAIRKQLVLDDPGNLDYKFALAALLGKRGDISGMEGFPNLGDLPRALESYRHGLAIYEEILKIGPESEKYTAGYAVMLHFYGMLQSTSGDSEGAIENGRRAVAIFESLIAANPNNAKYETQLMAALVFMRYPLVDEKLFDEALSNAKRVIQTMEKQHAADPKNAFIKRSLGVSYNALGRIQTDMGNGAAASENHAKAIRFAEELLAADPQNGENQRDLAMTREFAAEAHAKKGDCLAALENYRKAIEAYGPSSSDDLSATYSGMGKCLASLGRLAEGGETFRKGLPLAEKIALKSPMNVKRQTRLAVFYLEGGRVFAKFAEAGGGPASRAEASELIRKSHQILNELNTSGKLSKLNTHFLEEARLELAKFQT